MQTQVEQQHNTSCMQLYDAADLARNNTLHATNITQQTAHNKHHTTNRTQQTAHNKYHTTNSTQQTAHDAQ